MKLDKDIAFYFIAGLIVGICTTLMTFPIIGEKIQYIKHSEPNPLDVMDAAKNYVNNVSEFYKYNRSNIGKELTMEQLKAEGGVCHHYAELYKSMAENDSYYAKNVVIFVNTTLTHEFTVMSNQNGYCIIDNLNYYCGKFGEKNVK